MGIAIIACALPWIALLFVKPPRSQCNCLCCTPEDSIKNHPNAIEPPPRFGWKLLRGDG